MKLVNIFTLIRMLVAACAYMYVPHRSGGRFSLMALCRKTLHIYTIHVDHPVPDEDKEPERQDHNDWAWLPLYAALTTLAYLWTPKQDPIPEVSFPFFLQHMLYTGEV